MSAISDFAGKLKDSIFWSLRRNRPFIINGEYKLELIRIDHQRHHAIVRVTNLKTGEVVGNE